MTNREEEKIALGKEIATHMMASTTDAQYVYALVLYGVQQGLLDEHEAELIKTDLDIHFHTNAKEQKNEVMMCVMEKAGFTPTKILWEIINQLPKYAIGEETLIVHAAPICKKHKISEMDFWKIINSLYADGYINKSGKEIKINFQFIVNMLENK